MADVASTLSGTSTTPAAPTPSAPGPMPAWVTDEAAFREAESLQAVASNRDHPGYRQAHDQYARLLRKAGGQEDPPTEEPSPATERAAMDARAHGLDRPFPGEASSPELAALGQDARGLGFTMGASLETTTRWVSEYERGLARQEKISDLDAAQERDRCERELRGCWGEGYDTNVRLLMEVLSHYPRLRDGINESGLGRNATFLRELFTAAHRERTLRESEAIFKKHGRRLAGDVEGA